MEQARRLRVRDIWSGNSNMDKYSRIIYWSDDDKQFIVEVPELPGCMADGSTPEEALKISGAIVSEWIETAEILGREIPEPSYGRMTA